MRPRLGAAYASVAVVVPLRDLLRIGGCGSCRCRHCTTGEPTRGGRAGPGTGRMHLNGVDHVRAWRGAGHGRGQRSRGDRHVGRQPERPRQLRGSSSARDRSGDARPSGVSVHARRRRRPRGVRVRQPRRVASKFAVVAAGVGNRVRTVPQLHGAAARSPQRRPAWPLCVSTADGPRQRRPGLRTVGGAPRPTRPRGRPEWGEDWGPRFRVGLRGANVDSDAYPPVPGRRRESTVRAGAANADAPGKGLSANQG